jgi:hypothetical protein
MHTKFSVGKFEGNRPLGSPRRRWEYNTEWEAVDWIHIAQDRHHWGGGDLMNTLINQVTYKTGNFVTE